MVIRSQVPRTLVSDLSGGEGPGLSPDQLPPDLVAVDYGIDAGMENAGGYVKVCLRVYLTHTGEKPACNVSLVASCPSFVHVAPRNVVIQKVGGAGQQSTPIMVKLYLYALKTHLPTGM